MSIPRHAHVSRILKEYSLGSQAATINMLWTIDFFKFVSLLVIKWRIGLCVWLLKSVTTLKSYDIRFFITAAAKSL